MRCSVCLYLILIVSIFLAPPYGINAGQLQEPDQWRITEKEVIAVQVALIQSGYLKSKPTGVLDRDTRSAVRAYQIDKGLNANGRIDRQTYESLRLAYPATGKEAESLRSDALLPKIGYGIKDTTVSAGHLVTGAAGKVKEGTRSGLEKTWDYGEETMGRAKGGVQALPDASMRGLRSVGRGSMRLSSSLIGRNDADVHKEVRQLLSEDPETERWFSDVKNGMVTIKTPPGYKADLGQVISNIRKIAGVKSVFVICL